MNFGYISLTLTKFNFVMAAPYATRSIKQSEDILNFCTKYLSRGAKLFVGEQSDSSSNLTTISENWRFPLILPVGSTGSGDTPVNEVVFIYYAKAGEFPDSIEVTGSFAPLYESFPMLPILYEGENIGYYYYSVILPPGKGYYYRFRVNGTDIVDPINPQKKIFRNGKEWSFFFTDYYNYSEDFEEWEMNLLQRLVQQVVPFRTHEAQNFINRFYLTMSKNDKLAMPIYKLDESVGEINFITNILAREERHHLQDYKICLNLIDQLLRKRNPFLNSWEVSQELIADLYNEMATGNVVDWDYSQYDNPMYFLSLIRRHTITGAFSHPKYGGNIGGAGWSYLQERYDIKNENAQTVGNYFNWELALEKPLGTNENYQG
jgi:hypothetical protein